ncbi:carbohydrate-binding module family 1 protein [Gonapodya prolifera JEL478]|uniref:AA9 family lytic polysaccharide monooxygenase n=1 Tax=Gonapodya prolifera (strain JEL478) TaxID=1344416 RepID=A0A139A857_GONPJ|nr:carbohydrate-binding module family 1 protein [Gonapodya prolifera JEL478]|eukprot:KXS12868.1 carbohydrate-binding module family 1 protein [Gonapodya prolifera JEL478]
MPSTRTLIALAALALLFTPLVSAHTFIFGVNTPSKKNAQCIRGINPPGISRNSPVKSLTSQDMVCGFGPTTAAQEACTAAPGETVELIYGHNNAQDDVIDPSHVGPCEAYLQQRSSATAAPANGGWFKIYEETYSAATGWCTINLIKNKGILKVTLPQNLPAGDYLLRAEINALHEADALASAGRGAQFYIQCAEITVSGTPGTVQASPQVNIPGHLTDSTPGVVFNLYTGGSVLDKGANYPNPFGPAVATIGGAGQGAGAPVPPPATTPPPPPPPASPPAGTPPSSPPAGTPTVPAPAGGSYTWNPNAQGCWAPSAASQAGTVPVAPPPANCAGQWEQCGGKGFTGPTCCSIGSCKQLNEWYFQCLV